MMFAVLLAALGYLDLTEVAVGAYDDARMEEYVREAETVGVQEHGFPRLASNLGQLVAAGRMQEKKPLLDRMLTAACACARKGKMPPKSGGNEFSVRELTMAVVSLEKAGVFPAERIAAWKADLAAVEAHRCYTSEDAPLADRVGRNWPLFGAASEQARIHYGLGGDPAFVESWVSDQLRHFDRNGMYRDPNEPATYDFIGRMLYMQILHFGYKGPCRAKIIEELLASAEPTLAMLSVCGEFPYGGRSNQFLHNQTLYAAVAEWYAAFFAKRGEKDSAARFRDAARRAIDALGPWIADGAVFHVKNRFPKPDVKNARNVDQHWFGCENYAYFDKYMITMGSWAVLAREFADGGRGLFGCLGCLGSQAAQPGNANTLTSNNQNRRSTQTPKHPNSFSTSPRFHWRFTHSANYTVQEDWKANPQYDATGIGRIHRRGAPPAICLSAPFAEKPNYFIGVEKNPGPFAIAAENGKLEYKVSDWGVELSVAGDVPGQPKHPNTPNTRTPILSLPVFEFDGEEETRVEFAVNLVKVHYRGWVCRYATRGGKFIDTGLKYFNRNGRYRRVDCISDSNTQTPNNPNTQQSNNPNTQTPNNPNTSFTVYVTIERENRGSCICGVAPERADDFYWENGRVGFRLYGPGDFHRWSGVDLFRKQTPSNAVERLLREPGCHGDWHGANPLAVDDFAVGSGPGVGAVRIFADGEWKTCVNWETAEVIHEGDDYLEFELVYPACCALGRMIYHITMKKDDDFFRNEVRFEYPRQMRKGWIVRPEIREDPACAAKPFLRFSGDGSKPNFSYEAGFTVAR